MKGSFRRPFARPAASERPLDGGRVTELTARPLLSAFYPELAGFVQPLAGEVAARRDFFDRLPFATGYAVETAMLLDARDLLGGTAGMAQVDLDVRRNRHQPLPELGPMAYAVLRVVLDRLRADGRLLDDHAPPLQTATAGCPGRAGGAPAVRLDPRRRPAVRCVYTDLDGTLLGRGASLFRNAEGDFTLLAARALEACHRAGAEVVIKSGRRRAQVMEDARLLGQTSYIFEVGSGMVIDGELTFLTGELAAAGRAARSTPRSPSRARPRCCWSATPAGSSRTRPGTSTARCRTCSAGWSTCARPTSCWPTEGHGDLRLVDNG